MYVCVDYLCVVFFVWFYKVFGIFIIVWICRVVYWYVCNVFVIYVSLFVLNIFFFYNNLKYIKWYCIIFFLYWKWIFNSLNFKIKLWKGEDK